MSEVEDKCVYLHKDKEGVVRYVGSGSLRRANSNNANTRRGEDYAEYVHTNGKLQVEIISQGLSKIEAENLERELYDKHRKTILNVRRPSSEKTMTKNMFNEYLYYDETSKSCLRWKIDVGCNAARIKANSEAGTLDSQGYYRVGLNGERFQSHRIVALFHNWAIEGKVIDHIDRVRSNNTISNLRVVTQKENSNNLSLSSKNNSGVQGVHFDKQNNRWVTSWLENQKLKCKYFTLSTYKSSEEAKKAAIDYRQKMVDLHYNRSKETDQRYSD